MSSSISPEQMEVYRAAARVREAHYRQQMAQRRAAAMQGARVAAQRLRNEFGATRVVVFGSTAREGVFHERSDIDLAVEGVKSKDYYRAWAAAEEGAPGFTVSLTTLETAGATLLATIEAEGIDL